MSFKVNKNLPAALEKFFEAKLHKAAKHVGHQAVYTQKTSRAQSPFYAPGKPSWRGKTIASGAPSSGSAPTQGAADTEESPLKKARQARAQRFFNKAMPKAPQLWGAGFVKQTQKANTALQMAFRCLSLTYGAANQLVTLAAPIHTGFSGLSLLQRNASDVLGTPQKVLNLAEQIRTAYNTKQHYNEWQAFINQLPVHEPYGRFDAKGNNTTAAWQEAFGKYCKDQHHYLEEGFKIGIKAADLGLHVSAAGLNALSTVTFVGGLIGLATGGEASAVLMPLSAGFTIGASVASTSKAGLVIGYEGVYKPLRSGLKWYQKNQWAKADLASPDSKRYQKAQDQVYASLKARVQKGELSATALQQESFESFRTNLHAQTLAILNEQRSHTRGYQKALQKAQADWQALQSAGLPAGADEQSFVTQRTDALIQAERMRRDSGLMSSVVAQNLVREQSAYLSGEHLYLDTTAPWTQLVMSGLGLVDHELEAVLNQDTPEAQAALLQALVKKSKKILKESGQEAPVPMPGPSASDNAAAPDRVAQGQQRASSSQQARTDGAQWSDAARPQGPAKAATLLSWQRTPKAQVMQRRKAEAQKLATQYLGKPDRTNSKSKASRLAGSLKGVWDKGLGHYKNAKNWSGLLYGPLQWNKRCLSILTHAVNAQNLDRAAGLASNVAFVALDAFQIPGKVIEAYEAVVAAKNSVSTYKGWDAAKAHYQQQQGPSWFDAQKGEAKPEAYFAAVALNCRSRNDPIDKTIEATLSVGEVFTHTAGVASGVAATLTLLGVATAPVAAPLAVVSLHLGTAHTGISMGHSLYKTARQGYRWYQKQQLQAADKPAPNSSAYQKAQKRAAKALQAQGKTPQDPEYSSALQDKTELILTRKRVRSTGYQAARKEALKELESLRAAGVPVASDAGFVTRYIDTKVQTQRMRVDTAYAARVLVEHLHQEQGRYKAQDKLVPELTDQTPFTRFLMQDLKQNQAGLETVLNLDPADANQLVASWLKKASPPAVAS
jgi:hypothetical protein